MNIWNIIYLNCGERYEDIIDHRSYTHNLSIFEIKILQKFRPGRDWNPYFFVRLSFHNCLSEINAWQKKKEKNMDSNPIC